MTAVIYARYSSERQTEQSIEGQLRECREYADANNIKIVGEYIDRAKTGRNDDRAEFQKMLRDSAGKAFEAVIVWKIDRFGRSREDIAKNKAILRRNGVSVLYAREHIPEGAEGIILEGLLESLAEYYSAELREKITRGMRESAYKCQFNGSGLPLGYDTTPDHKYVINETEASIVRRFFDLYDAGHTIADIMRYANENALKTKRGGKFSISTITKILTNRRYTGTYIWRDIVVPGGIPQIITPEQFERVQEEMAKNKKAPARVRGADEAFLLTGKAFCGLCKSPMIGDSGTGKSGKKWHYYTCAGKKQKRSCTKKSVSKEWLESEVVRLTAAAVLNDETIGYIAGRVEEIQLKERKDHSELEYLTGKLAETERAIANIVKAIEAGVFSAATGERLRELEAQRDELRFQVEKEKAERPLISKDHVIFFLNKFKGGDVTDRAYQRQVIDVFVNKVLVYDDKLVITYNFSGDGNEITAETVEKSAENGVEGIPGGSDKDSIGPPGRAWSQIALRALSFV